MQKEDNWDGLHGTRKKMSADVTQAKNHPSTKGKVITLRRILTPREHRREGGIV